jgi:hypothetical protein
MKNIRFTGHAMLKMEVLNAHGVKVTMEEVKKVILEADTREAGHGGRMVAQKRFGAEHVLRVVCEETAGEILVITMYPGRRERYEKSQLQH